MRNLVDLRQVYEAWHAAELDLAHKYAGSMFWREVNGTDYLKRKIRSVEKSLGRRSPETEEIFRIFVEGRAAARERHDSLAKSVDVQAAIARTIGLGRVPPIVARLLRRLDEVELLGHIRVVGTNAMFAYEAIAGVTFSADALATGDIDLLLDARRELKIVVDDGTERTIMGVLRTVDRSFEKVTGRSYRAVNREGFMVDLIRPEPRPAWKSEPGAQPLAEADLDPSPIQGLQWLINSPPVSALIIDGRGFPAPIVVPDPRIWLL
ncbi:MAG TPA: GSU2403 family nucleotidyltransferase fold protein, partial [Magnetospirillaceae bacterium]|nr:GSU2403 family nucleotidyltransferase fold protein [Magnetospirillaceae bacterium]